MLPRPSYTCIISVPSLRNDPFSSWLSCKFGLDEADLTSWVETPLVDVEFRMVDQVDDESMVRLTLPGETLEVVLIHSYCRTLTLLDSCFSITR